MYKRLSALLPRNKNGIALYIYPALRSYSTETEEKIIIPKEIPRGPTDILKALSKTVHRDPTAAHYKYHDDPYLMPYSNLSKRSYALSQEAGRKAAQWIREQHSELFQHRVAEPTIEAYLPKAVYNEDSNVTEESLKNSILNICVSDAITIYNLLKKKGIEISKATKQNLLELICYYNGDDPLDEDWIEERWYRQGKKSREKWKNSWKDGGLAEQLFRELGGKDSQSICALICGMCLHGQLDKAWNFYEEAKFNGIKLNTTTYNSLLAKACFIKESHPMAMECIGLLLANMEKDKAKPNLGTLNSTLESLSNISSHNNARIFALNILAEFRYLGIEPSLASFYHLMNLYNSERSYLSGVISDALNYLEKNSFEISDLKDVLFFSRAMELISARLQDVDLAHRLNELLNKSDNYNFIGDSYKESLYYRYYLLLLCKIETIDSVMEMYDYLVPNIYVPEPSIMKEILTVVKDNEAWHLLPRLWSDIIIFNQADQTSALEMVLSLAARNTDESLSNAMANIGWSVWERIENSITDRIGSLEWTGPLLGDLMLILVDNGDLSKAHLVMDKMEKLQDIVLGEPKVSALIKYLELCIKENSPDTAIKCIRYCSYIGFTETEEMARKLYNSLQLKEQQVERLISIVGEKALRKEKKKKSKV